MPVLDGYETTRQIRAREHLAELPVIALTANAMKEDVERAMACGMDDHIAKPIEPAHLFATIEHWVGRKRGAGLRQTSRSGLTAAASE